MQWYCTLCSDPCTDSCVAEWDKEVVGQWFLSSRDLRFFCLLGSSFFNRIPKYFCGWGRVGKVNFVYQLGLGKRAGKTPFLGVPGLQELCQDRLAFVLARGLMKMVCISWCGGYWRPGYNQRLEVGRCLSSTVPGHPLLIWGSRLLGLGPLFLERVRPYLILS